MRTISDYVDKIDSLEKISTPVRSIPLEESATSGVDLTVSKSVFRNTIDDDDSSSVPVTTNDYYSTESV